jgi:hypothetical protein
MTAVIYQFLNKQFLKAAFTGILFIGTFATIIIYTLFTFFIETIDGDGWADNLQIPKGIRLENPVDLSMDGQRPDSIIQLIKKNQDFQLYNSFQPGLYEYDFWTGKIDSGIVYLKAFEITQEYALSSNRLPKTTKIKVYNPKDSIIKFSTNSDFTIYEGDWEKPYAARFEVWYKPFTGREERKLISKNFKIEGWQR